MWHLQTLGNLSVFSLEIFYIQVRWRQFQNKKTHINATLNSFDLISDSCYPCTAELRLREDTTQETCQLYYCAIEEHVDRKREQSEIIGKLLHISLFSLRWRRDAL